MSAPTKSAVEIIDELANNLMLLEPSDRGGVRQLLADFQELLALFRLKSDGRAADTGELLDRCVRCLQKLHNGEIADAAEAIEKVTEALTAMQPVFRDRTTLRGSNEMFVYFGLPARNTYVLPANIDQQTFAEFVASQSANLDDFEEYLVKIERDKDPEDVHALRRLIHTLKGETGLLGIDDVEKLCHVMEDNLRDGGFPAEISDDFFEALDWLRSVFVALTHHESFVSADALTAKFENFSGRNSLAALEKSKQLPEIQLVGNNNNNTPAPVPAATVAEPETPEAPETHPAGVEIVDADLGIAVTTDEKMQLPDNVDEEIFAAFVGEQLGRMDDLEQMLLQAERGDKIADLADLRGLIHTLKGDSALMGLDQIEHLCHAVEDNLRNGYPLGLSNVLFTTLDWLRSAFTELSRGHAIASPRPLIDIFNRTAAGAPVPATNKITPSPLKPEPVAPAVKAPAPAAAKTAPVEKTAPAPAVKAAPSATSVSATPVASAPSATPASATPPALAAAKEAAAAKAPEKAENVAAAKAPVAASEAVDAEGKPVDPLVVLATKKITSTKPIIFGPPRPRRRPPDMEPAGHPFIAEAAAVKITPEPAAAKQETEKVMPLDESGLPPAVKRAFEPAPAVKAAPRPAPEPKIEASSGGAMVREMVRVDSDRLDRLLDTIGELVIAESMVDQSINKLTSDQPVLVRQIGQLSKITRTLQEIGMSLRMMPIRGVFNKMERLVRDLSHKSNKNVRLETIGEDTELDKSLIERIGDILVHMVRNSVDHGIESAVKERVELGKPEAGKVTLRAYHKGGNVCLDVSDDGRGLDREKIIAKAEERGLTIPGGESASDSEVFKVIFEQGFSTAEKVTDVSGRGVGMDVVKRNVDAMRGRIEINSAPGRGTNFSIRLPLTLAIIDGMVVRVAKERYIIPTLSILHSLQMSRKDVVMVVGKGEMVRDEERELPMFRLSSLLNTRDAVDDVGAGIVLIVEADGRRLAILCDEILEQQQVVIKSLGDYLAIPGIAGGAIMPDGLVGLIIDIGGLLDALDKAGRAA
ncbi:MAG: Hpt domain-containing protein [Planctomycetota bacterium]|jgi:two-component system chemotaxis sensor kinase CheA|nr:Hpt domain-containing protein [Planctomycetota bacterium]